MRIINWNTYTRQSALIIAALYVLEFTYLKIGLALIFFKLVLPLLFLLFTIHVTKRITPYLKKVLKGSVQFGSITFSFYKLMVANIVLTYANLFVVVTKDTLLAASSLPLATIATLSILMCHSVVFYLIMQIVFKRKHFKVK